MKNICNYSSLQKNLSRTMIFEVQKKKFVAINNND